MISRGRWPGWPGMSAILIGSVVWIGGGAAAAQDTEPARRADQPPGSELPNSALIDDLLDLLQPPAKIAPAEPPPGDAAAGEPVLRPADVGLDGEDLGEAPGNPLIAVKQSMLIAAGWLQRGKADASTRQLQSDIVTRLDELIRQLEQSRKDNSPEEQQPQEQDRQDQQQQRQENQRLQSEQQQRAGSAERPPLPKPGEPSLQGKPMPGQSPDEPGGQPAGLQPAEGPGEQGPVAPARIDLADPAALQEGVWGQLPEQVRKQMQSRMVDQFHPAYRRQIEAYFQALLKIPPPNKEPNR